MISPDTVKKLAQNADSQCLTLYFNTGPKDTRSAWQARFKKLLRNVDGIVTGRDHRAFDAAVARVTSFLEQYQPKGNSFLVYATKDSWQEFTSRVPVRDELHWGKPDISQLLWLLEEYRPYGVLICDQQHVRFMAVRMDEFEEYHEFSTNIDTDGWRRRHIGSSGRGKAVVKGGYDAKAFDARYMEQVRHFWRTLDKPIAELLDRFHVQRLVLAGNKSLLPEFARSLAPSISAAVVTQVTLDAFSSPADAVKRISPAIAEWEAARDSKLVAELLDAASISRKAAVGIEAVSQLIQEGRAARVFVARDFDRPLNECAICGHVTAGTGKTCPLCDKGTMARASIASALPRLVLSYNVPVEVMKGKAGEELAKNGGVGAFLRF